MDRIMELMSMVSVWWWVGLALIGLVGLVRGIVAWRGRNLHRKVLMEFMEALKIGTFPSLRVIGKTWASNHPMKHMLGLVDLRVKKYKILKCEPVGKSKVLVRYTMSVLGRYGAMKVSVTVVRERKAYKPSVTGRWGVVPNGWRKLA